DSDNAIIVFVVFIRIVEAGVAARDTSVDAHLDASDPKPLIAETRNETKFDETSRTNVRLDDARQKTYACMHPAFAVDLLIGAHRFPRTDDVVNRRDAPLQTLV